MKPTLQTIRQESEAFKHCIINLLTDIETFSISVVGTNNQPAITDDSSNYNAALSNNNLSLTHEIQLLIDECLVLIVGAAGSIRQPVCDQYRGMFESWLVSSRDSPILSHFINRISRNYNLLIASSTSESYCHLLELCLDIFFETDREQIGGSSGGQLEFESSKTKNKEIKTSYFCFIWF